MSYTEKRSIAVLGLTLPALKEQLEDIMEGLRNPTLLVEGSGCACTITLEARGENEGECELMLTPVVREITGRLGEYIYGEDGDTPESVVLTLLRQRGMTLSAAESCTGGLLAKRLTDIPGASDRFAGGVVVYTEAVKCRLLGMKQAFIDENGVVSAAVADKMARRVRKTLGSDLGIGITGWAGPGGEDVGIVYVALAWKDSSGKTMSCVRRLTLGDIGREIVRTAAADHGLDMARRYLCGLEL